MAAGWPEAPPNRTVREGRSRSAGFQSALREIPGEETTEASDAVESGRTRADAAWIRRRIRYPTAKKHWTSITPPPYDARGCPKGPPQWARTPELVQDGTLRRGMRRREAKETLNQH